MNGLNRIIVFLKWLPLIWKIRDWDYGYMLLLMLRQLQNIRKRKEWVQYTNAEEILGHLDKCIEILERQCSEDYPYSNIAEEQKDYKRLMSILKKHGRRFWT